ncbi:MAG: thymidylate kinase [Phycisphaerales bacterium]|nr:MAG: thymidylate kinase [Phycisphaerales bacterium]
MSAARRPSAPIPPAWLHALQGRFLVFEGPDGSGKSTQLRRLESMLRDAGVPCIAVREPGGTAAGEAIREVLLDHRQADMDVRCEMLLYMASRAQLVAERIAPALAQGQVVLADRFVASTLAYQGAAGGLREADILAVARVVTHGCKPHAEPDLNLVFDVDEATAAARLGLLLDRMEAKGAAFHARVRRGYLDLVARHPDRYARIDAVGSEQAVFDRVLAELQSRFADADA